MNPYRSIDWTALRPGDRIEWRRDHVSERPRVGTVAANYATQTYAWPDDRNHGPEENGGCSIVKHADIVARCIR